MARFVLLACLLLAACQQTPSTDGSSGARPRSPDDVPQADRLPTESDPVLLRFHKVDMLIAQWDAAQAGTRTEQADQLFAQVRAEVDEAFEDFAGAARGERGLSLRYLGVSALGFSGRSDATKLLEEVLGERDPGLVGNALIALKLRADPQTSIAPILKMISSTAPEPRRYAPLALANVLEARRQANMPLDPELARSAAQLLTGVVADRDPYVRLHTAKALGALRSPGTYELLMILMKDEHVRIQVAAAAALERLGDPRGFPEVVRLLGEAPEELKPIVGDILVSYAASLQGAPLAPGDAERLAQSPLAWGRWFNDLRARQGLPTEPTRRRPVAAEPPRPQPAGPTPKPPVAPAPAPAPNEPTPPLAAPQPAVPAPAAPTPPTPAPRPRPGELPPPQVR